jgi:type III pantothenate kinase
VRLPESAVTGIAIASVVPPLTRPMEEMCERYFSQKALVIDATNAGMTVRYTPAGDVGADRIVNAVAAWDKYGKRDSRPLIVVDFGTGTTFDVISTAGEYLGGVICPGINISAEALFQRAARLPRVEVRKPPVVIGQNTVNAMQSGLFFGYVEMVDGLIRRIRAELAGGDKAITIATGGLAEVISGESAFIEHVDPNLTLDGLRLIWQRTH